MDGSVCDTVRAPRKAAPYSTLSDFVFLPNTVYRFLDESILPFSDDLRYTGASDGVVLEELKARLKQIIGVTAAKQTAAQALQWANPLYPGVVTGTGTDPTGLP